VLRRTLPREATSRDASAQLIVARDGRACAAAFETAPVPIASHGMMASAAPRAATDERWFLCPTIVLPGFERQDSSRRAFPQSGAGWIMRM
jgi:hypothetical protein